MLNINMRSLYISGETVQSLATPALKHTSWSSFEENTTQNQSAETLLKALKSVQQSTCMWIHLQIFGYPYKWAPSSKKMPSNMHKMRRFISSCGCPMYHLGLCSPFIHSVVSNDSVSRQWRPWPDCMDPQADLGLHWLHIPEDTFSSLVSK